MAWIGKDHNDHLVPTPCYVQGRQPADQAAQSHIQPGLECLQGRGILHQSALTWGYAQRNCNTHLPQEQPWGSDWTASTHTKSKPSPGQFLISHQFLFYSESVSSFFFFWGLGQHFGEGMLRSVGSLLVPPADSSYMDPCTNIYQLCPRPRDPWSSRGTLPRVETAKSFIRRASNCIGSIIETR